MRRANRALVLCLCAAAVPPGAAAAQSFTGQSAELQLGALARGAQAVWVNPAGLASREASIEAHLTARNDSSFSFANVGIAIATGGLAFGYQRDRRGDGSGGSAYALAVGLGDSVFSLGFSRRWYKSGEALEGTWDLGTRWRPSPRLSLALAWRDAGSPLIRDTTVNAVFVPGAALTLGPLALGGEWELVASGWGTSAVRAGAQLRLGASLAIGVVGSLSGRPEARLVAVQLEWSRVGARAGTFAVAGTSGASDHVGITGALVSRPLERRRWR